MPNNDYRLNHDLDNLHYIGFKRLYRPILSIKFKKLVVF